MGLAGWLTVSACLRGLAPAAPDDIIWGLLLGEHACLATLNPRQHLLWSAGQPFLEAWPAPLPSLKEFRWNDQVQVVALECLPCIPAHMLGKALGGEELAKRIAQCLNNSSKEVCITHTLPPACTPCTAN